MGFMQPTETELPDDWERQPRMQRVQPMVRSWAEAGFGTPDAVFVVYLVKIALYVLGAALVTTWTTDVGGLGDIGSWWSEPIFFQKVIVFTLLFEVLGFGCGWGPLTLRFIPPMGAFLYWLRPGTVRLAPWPGRVPGTAGTTRTWLDVALYAGVIAAGVWLLIAPVRDGGAFTQIDPVHAIPLFILLPLIGLRDKAIFLAARTEVYGVLALTFVLTGTDMIVALKFVFVAIWWGAAFSKINHHFPFVVSVMESNGPLIRSKRLKRRLYANWPEDIRPSKLSATLAHGGTVFEFTVPLILLLSNGGWVTNVAAIAMILFHLHILSAIPMGVPLEWNVFMIFGIGVLFFDWSHVGPGGADQPWAILALCAGLATMIIAGNLFPDRIAFLIGMRYYAGNWATSLWAIKPSAVAKIDAHVTKIAQLPEAQLERIYGADMAYRMMHKGMAFRAMHSHGRALFGLVGKLVDPAREDDWIILDGELVAGVVLGWNFGEGHLHNEQLLDALDDRCGFEPGEIAAVILEGQPLGKPWQAYRLYDPAEGELEAGRVLVRDMIARQPWDTDIPAQVLSTRIGAR